MITGSTWKAKIYPVFSTSLKLPKTILVPASVYSKILIKKLPKISNIWVIQEIFKTQIAIKN